MRKTLAVVAQFLLFFAVFLAGSVFGSVDPLKLRWFVTHPTPTETRYFSPEGLILMVLLFLGMIGFDAARHRLKEAGTLTAIAFFIALFLGMLSKFGWATHDLF